MGSMEGKLGRGQRENVGRRLAKSKPGLEGKPIQCQKVAWQDFDEVACDMAVLHAI